ncbi:hypothetical protein FACS1894139_14350 [Planctomycetales bacterium]|nr:hypothetical protein FACS1894107_08780 [Planctomycetales bacterium]GHS98289.1 hypothetical protein FACS1894108_06180 [Planctomycetales bacterium]GHT07044.1 hypothetical protein FACS1894139_14350 [Planctomycetales bacterium]
MPVIKPSVYIETTVPSVGSARISTDIIIAGKQATTKLFWEHERHKFDLYVSQYVIDECALGDAEAAKRRLAFIGGITVIPKSDAIEDLALVYRQLLQLPDSAKYDSYHLAAGVNLKIDYLLSWNFRHLGTRSNEKIRAYNERHNLWTPFLIAPDLLLTLPRRK